MGQLITSHAHITTNGSDSYLYNNDYWWTRAISAAYDPNDKSVSPIGTGNNGGFLLSQNRLDYLISFQNVGTADAQNV